MKLIKLEITRAYSYSDTIGALEGNVKLADWTTGSKLSNEINAELSPETIARIINLIAKDVQAQAVANVARISGGLRDAAIAPLELDANGLAGDGSGNGTGYGKTRAAIARS